MATAALWTEQRPSFGDWATETRQGVSRGGGGGGDGRVARSRVARFCADGRRCARRSVGKGRLVDGKTPPEWRLGGGNAAGRFPWGGRSWHGRVAPSRVAQFYGDVLGAASETAALWTGQRPSIGGWATEKW